MRDLHCWFIVGLCLALLTFPEIGSAQKFLQLERSGSLKTIRFGIGDEMVFKLKGDDHGWYSRFIQDIDMNRGAIVFSKESIISPDSIEAIRLPDSKLLQIAGYALQVGGANMILFSAYYSIFQDRKLDGVTMLSGVGNILVGQLLRKVLAKRKFKPGKRKRLRLLDLRFSEDDL